MIRKGTKVKWNWGNGTAEGEVVETYTSKTTKTIKGNKVTRTAKKATRPYISSKMTGIMY
jgi:hypothetical protein